MATLTVTFAAGAYGGSGLRALASAIDALATAVPDQTPGQAVTLLVDNAPATGSCGVTLGGPWLPAGSASRIVG